MYNQMFSISFFSFGTNKTVLWDGCENIYFLIVSPTYMFVLRVRLVLLLAVAAVLGDVDVAAGQVGQQVLDQTGGRLGLAGR